MHYTIQLTSFLHHSMPDSLFCQPPVDESPLTKTPSPIRFSNRVPMQPNCPKPVNQEMITAGLVESSCLLHPFKHPDYMDDGDLPPPSVAEIALLLDEFLDDPGHLRIFVPNSKELKFRIMRAYHDSPLGMRRERDNTYHALARDFYWKGMGKEMKRWVARCQEYMPQA